MNVVLMVLKLNGNVSQCLCAELIFLRDPSQPSAMFQNVCSDLGEAKRSCAQGIVQQSAFCIADATLVGKLHNGGDCVSSEEDLI